MKILSYSIEQFLALIHGKNRAAPAGTKRYRLRPSGRAPYRLRMGNDGQSLVEFALLLPVLMAVLTGIFSLGFALWNYMTLEGAVAASAEFLAAGGKVTNTNGTEIDPCTDGFAQITKMATGLDTTQIAVTYTMNGHVDSFTKGTTNTCSTDAQYLGAGDVKVKASYPCNIGIYGVSFSADCVLTASKTETAYGN